MIAGADRDEIGVADLSRSSTPAARLARDLPPMRRLADVLDHRGVRAEFRRWLTSFARRRPAAPTASRARILLDEPPSIDAGEITDKGSINQRAVLTHRAALVDELYAEPPSPRVIVIDAKPEMADHEPALTHDLRRRLAARRRAHALRRLQRRARARLADRSRHQGGARSVRRAPASRREDVGTVITGNMAQASFDAYLLPRHVGLYAGVPIEVPAHHGAAGLRHRHRDHQAGADAVSLGRADLALCVGAESMSRNPIAAYTHRGGFRHGAGRVQGFPVGGAARSGRQRHHGRHRGESRAAVSDHPAGGRRVRGASSFERALAAQAVGFLGGRDRAGDERDLRDREGYKPRGLKLQGREGTDRRHACPALAARGAGENPPGVRRRADRRQLLGHRRRRGGGAGGVVGLREEERQGRRSRASSPAPSVGVPPEIMGIGPVPAIRAVLDAPASSSPTSTASRSTRRSARRCIACARELGLDEAKLNVNGGAIAIGHPLGATGVRLAVTLARELQRSGSCAMASRPPASAAARASPC